MAGLDDMKFIQKYDKSGMLETLESFPGQCARAKKIGLDFDPPDSFKGRYKNIVCTGMGGSAIGADIARSYVADEAKAPLIVNRNYSLPNFVDRESIVIAASYSGNTEETLSAYKDAKKKNARIIAITSGGDLKAMADKDGFPVLLIPGGLQPRCAVGYSFFPLLITLSKLGLVPDKSKEINGAIKTMEYIRDNKIGQKVPQANNYAKKIAKEIHLKYPVIYGSADHIDSVVTRWRGQLSENAKTISSGHLFPEMNHNEIVGWQYPKNTLKDFTVILLRDIADHPRVSRRIDITADILKDEGIKVIEVNSTGDDLLGRIFSLIYIGDFVSFYLAVLNRTDPTPVKRIAYLKDRLARI